MTFIEVLRVEVQNLGTNYNQKCDDYSLPRASQNPGLYNEKGENKCCILLLTTEA